MQQWKAHLALMGANLIYGINYTVAKDVMPNYIEPFGFILLRVFGAFLLFWLLLPISKRESIEREDWLRLALCGLFGVAMNQMLFFQGLNITQPINASIIMTTNPILVLIASALLLREGLGWRKISGILIGLTGAVLLILFKSSGTSASFAINSNTALGDFLVFLNAASYGIYLVMVKPLMKKYQPLTVIRWVFTFGLLYVVPFGVNEFGAIRWESMPVDIMLKAAFVVVGTTFFTYLFNIYALKRVEATAVSIYIYSQPIFATVVALSVGADSLTWIKITATLLIFSGVYLVSIASPKTKRSATA